MACSPLEWSPGERQDTTYDRCRMLHRGRPMRTARTQIIRLDDDTGTTILVGTPKLPRDRVQNVVAQCLSGAIQLEPEPNKG